MNMDESMDLLLFLFLNRERTKIIKMDSNQSQVSNRKQNDICSCKCFFSLFSFVIVTITLLT